MKTVELAGRQVPVLGQGTWQMGEDTSRRKQEIAALQTGLDLGMTLIDTAEMYGEGASEELVGHAIQGRRNDVFLVTKAYPQNATRVRLAETCERSLRRLHVEQIDLYLLHWRGSVPLSEVVEAFQQLVADGKIASWGVSNLDVADLTKIEDSRFVTDQVLYNPEHRGIEHDLLPWCRQRSLPVMAYSPVGQGGGLLRARSLYAAAQRNMATTAQIALAWGLREPGVISIPKSASIAHVQDNAKAADISLDEISLEEIDTEFPPPTRKAPLSML